MSAPPKYERLARDEADLDIEAQAHRWASVDQPSETAKDTSETTEAHPNAVPPMIDGISAQSPPIRPILIEFICDAVFPMTGSQQLVLARLARSEQEALITAYRAFPILNARSIDPSTISFYLPSGRSHMLQRTLEHPLKLMPDVWDIIASSDDPPTQIIVKVEAADAALRQKYENRLPQPVAPVALVIFVIFMYFVLFRT